jgi:hypothetical protein
MERQEANPDPSRAIFRAAWALGGLGVMFALPLMLPLWPEFGRWSAIRPVLSGIWGRPLLAVLCLGIVYPISALFVVRRFGWAITVSAAVLAIHRMLCWIIAIFILGFVVPVGVFQMSVNGWQPGRGRAFAVVIAMGVVPAILGWFFRWIDRLLQDADRAISILRSDQPTGHGFEPVMDRPTIPLAKRATELGPKRTTEGGSHGDSVQE